MYVYICINVYMYVCVCVCVCVCVYHLGGRANVRSRGTIELGSLVIGIQVC